MTYNVVVFVTKNVVHTSSPNFIKYVLNVYYKYYYTIHFVGDHIIFFNSTKLK